MMTLDKAIETIRDDDAGSVKWAVATDVIHQKTEESKRLSLETLELVLKCLSRGSIATSLAACTLYSWTGRPWPDDINLHSHDPKEWETYLKENRFLANS